MPTVDKWDAPEIPRTVRGVNHILFVNSTTRVANTQETHPLMGTPGPSLLESDFQPPPYSSHTDSRSQGTETPVPAESSTPAPCPTMASVQQDTKPYYDPINQATTANGEPMSQPVPNSTPYAHTTCNPNPIIIVSPHPNNSRSRRTWYVIAVAIAISIVLAFTWRFHQYSLETKRNQMMFHDELRK